MCRKSRQTPYETGRRQESIRTAGGPRSAGTPRPLRANAWSPLPFRTDPSKYRDRIGQARDDGRNGNSRETAREPAARCPEPTCTYFGGAGRVAGAENTFRVRAVTSSFVGVSAETLKRRRQHHHEILLRSVSCRIIRNHQPAHSTNMSRV